MREQTEPERAPIQQPDEAGHSRIDLQLFDRVYSDAIIRMNQVAESQNDGRTH